MFHLLLWLDKLDPSLGDTFARYLLYLFETSKVVVLHGFFVTDHYLLL